MKALVISDIHGSGYYADKIREIVERENPEKIILLGDLYYHGPRNDLSQEYNPMKVAETLNSMKAISSKRKLWRRSRRNDFRIQI